MKISINDKTIEAREGESILIAARKNRIFIPTLCYMEKLLPIGSCRLCVVEVEGFEMPVTACTTKVLDGMTIRTETAALRSLRKGILELILLSHPRDCKTCDMGGRCQLEALVKRYEVEVPSYRVAAVPGASHEGPYATPAIVYRRECCISCSRCVRACREVVGRSVLDLQGNGIGTRMEVVAPERCISCGECLSVCPVGALIEATAAGSTVNGVAASGVAPKPGKKVNTICPYCGVGCSLELNVADNRIVRVTTNEFLGTNKGTVCVKGRFGMDFIWSPERLTMPLIRESGRFREASWDEALDCVAARLNGIRSESGPDSIGGLASARCTNEDNYVFQKFIRAGIGTNNVDHCARLCHASTVAGLAATLGSGAMTNSIADLREADVAFVIGSNNTATHPVIGMQLRQMARYGGTKIVVIDPRRTDLVDESVLWLAPLPGFDLAILNGLAHVILKEGLHDTDFIEQQTEGFEAFREVAGKYSPEFVEELTGVPARDIVKAARLYGTAKNAAIFYCMGITQHSKGTDNVKAISNLTLLCGQIGKPGSGVNPLRGQNNVQGACDMGSLPNVYPGYQAVTVEEIKGKFEKFWGAKLPAQPGLTVVEMTDAILAGKIRGMYIMGENPLVTDPDLSHVEKAFREIDFLVVQDIFLTETAKFAHVVLPAAAFAEKAGTFTNTERKVQLLRKALREPGVARQDWEIISGISTRMGYPLNYASAEEIFEELRKVTPQYAGITYKRLGLTGLQWPCPNESHPGTPILHKGRVTRGKGLFAAVEYRPSAEMADSDYPFILTTGRDYYQYHSATMTGKVRLLRDFCPECYAEIHPDDAGSLGIEDLDWVKVESRRGAVVTQARLTTTVPRGVIFKKFHYFEGAANRLTNPALDPICKIPELKVCAVRIEKYAGIPTDELKAQGMSLR